jgi:hypothetical protein
MSEKKNRGEWSELYVLLKILSSGEIQAESAERSGEGQKFPVISVSRKIDGVEHVFRVAGFNIEIIDTLSGVTDRTISRSELSHHSTLLLERIKHGSGRAFSIPEAASIMSALNLDKVSGGGEKTDLIITTYDSRIKRETKQGFSIKSFIGSKPTLLNASGATNIEYEIIGGISESDTFQLNNLGPIELVSSLYERGLQLVPTGIDNRFMENLRMIDSQMDLLVSHMVLASFRGEGRSMENVISVINEINPLKYSPTNSKNRYIHKVKDLLEAVALGMRPSSPWDGAAEAKGGHLITTSRGDVLFQHALDKDSLRNYLYENTTFDTPSRKRYKFGKISKNRFNLNFQIRFK